MFLYEMAKSLADGHVITPLKTHAPHALQARVNGVGVGVRERERRERGERERERGVQAQTVFAAPAARYLL